MIKETTEERCERILKLLKAKYPGKKSYDLDGRGLHFVCEIEPVDEHAEYDKAIEVMISTKPHKHFKMTQYYTVISGNPTIYVGNEIIKLHPGDKYTIEPGNIHWAESNDEAWVELYSEPGWTKEDHILVDKE